jgi:hypothetical protein
MGKPLLVTPFVSTFLQKPLEVVKNGWTTMGALRNAKTIVPQPKVLTAWPNPPTAQLLKLVTPNTMFSDNHRTKPWRLHIANSLMLLFFSFLLAGCLQKGDLNIDAEQQPKPGEAPTCVNVCGRATADEPDWGGCGKVGAKEREKCMALCEAKDAGPDAWKCAMEQPTCTLLFQKCGEVFLIFALVFLFK